MKKNKERDIMGKLGPAITIAVVSIAVMTVMKRYHKK